MSIPREDENKKDENLDGVSDVVSLSEPSPTEPTSTAQAAPTTADQTATQESGPSNPIQSDIQVFSAPNAGSSSKPNNLGDGSKTPSEVDEGFFEPSLSDVQSYHATVIARSKRLNEAPLLTSKHRDEERLTREKKKADKWPNTTIRIKFSDGTQIQRQFPSTSAIQPIYAFVRTALQPEVASKPFTLWQPPRFAYPEHPVPQPATKKNSYGKPIIPPANYGHVRGGPVAGLTGGTGGRESLGDLGLVPQSVLMVKWEDESMNMTGYVAPIKPELMDKVVPLPEPAQAVSDTGSKATPTSGGGASGSGGEQKKIPKWLQKGLMKRK